MPEMNQKFFLTDEHLKLLKELNVVQDLQDWQSPFVDQKRPYGNSDIVGDVARIIGIERIDTDCEAVLPKGSTERCLKLHAEIATALQIVLCTGVFEAGVYTTKTFGIKWEKKPF